MNTYIKILLVASTLFFSCAVQSPPTGGTPDIRGYDLCGYDPHNLIKGDSALGDCEAVETVGCCSHDNSRFCDDNLDCPLVFNPTSNQDYSECVQDFQREVGIRYSFVDDDTLKISSKKLFLPLILFIS
mgnify:CR=1 FL=1